MSEPRPRYLQSCIDEDLADRMVFIGGPRQVGKTTLARQIGDQQGPLQYFNWDRQEHRLAILRGEAPQIPGCTVFDEIHKYPRWKSLIKGLWDTRIAGQRIIVTGSSRLDVYRRGGDSLMGRFRYHRLHPFSLKELVFGGEPISEPSSPPRLTFKKTGALLEPLMRFGGFPEPLLAGSTRTHRRWRKERFERIFRDDIRDSENVRTLAQLELMASLLPGRVKSPLSMKSLSEDVEVSPNTIKTWLELLCRNYYLFRVPPWHQRLERALKKECKYYLWDWSEILDEGGRFENLVAAHLLKYCHFMEDTFGFSVDLYYVRDQQGREVDLLVVWDKKPWLLVECSLQSGHSLTALRYFGSRLGVSEVFLVTASDSHDHRDRSTGVHILPATLFLSALV